MDKRLGFETLNYEIFQSQIKSRYKSKIFIGVFQEKRLCEPLKCYRDLVIINEKSEKEFADDLKRLISDFERNIAGQVVIGVRKVDEKYQIFTELDDEIPFGKFWFQIKTVKFRLNEIQIKLKCLRSIDDGDTKSFAELLKSTTKATNAENPKELNDEKINTNDAIEPWKILLDFWKREISAFIAFILSISINRTTVTEFFRFVFLVIVSLISSLSEIIKYVGIFTIKFIERTTWLIHVLTPIALVLVDLCSKVIGGFYLLIAMIWKDSIGGARRQPPNYAIEGRPDRNRQAIQYRNNQ
ncbi:CLUMA_CG005735, isoform A [Clunio marinus]|uniref:CLUMA_CG005735, isoform A n=1 Tax=Clunio marinus TaxID=568069 RepID=A0A1J1HVP2_9DIPT|nr:CLUMA_CG005735, isoform A [Clunio marinus]